MSLLQKASIITTPTAYAEDYLYSIKPAYALGSELITNGTFDTDSDWGKGSGWTISGGKANRSGESGNSPINQNVPVVNGRKYTFSYTRKYLSGSSGHTNIFVKLDNVNYSTIGAYISTVVEEHTVTGEFTALFTGNLLWQIYGIGDFTGYVDNVSIKQVTDADFDFDRNSTGTRLNEDYLIEDVPYNLASYSEDFSNSYWTKTGATVESGFLAPYGSLNAYKLVEGTNNGIHIMNRTLTVVNTQVYSESIFVKSAERTKFGMRDGFSNNWITINLSSGSVIDSNGLISSEITKVANDWHKISFTFTAASTSATLKVYTLSDSYTSGSPETYFYQGDGSSGVYIWGAQLVKGDQPKDYLKTTDRLDIPRIDYTNGEPSILLEPQSTNLLPYSNDYSQSVWGKTNVTLTSNAVVSPDGTQNASKIVATGADGFLQDPITVTSGTTYTLSVYLKTVSGTLDTAISLGSPGFPQNEGEGGRYKNITVTNEWKRYTLTSTADASAATGIGVGGFNSFSTGEQVYVYGAQLEEGIYATSLIHTSGSAVTRSADYVNNGGNSDLFNISEGVLYAEIAALSDDQTARFYSISDGTSSNRIRLGFQSGTSNRFRALVVSGGSSTVDMNDADTTLSDITEYNKVAFKFKQNDFALYFNGREVKTDTSGNTPTALNTFAFDNQANTPSSFFYGKLKMVAVFKEALSDEELECLTGYNNHELYMNYYNRLSYLGLVEEYNVESDINNYIL